MLSWCFRRSAFILTALAGFGFGFIFLRTLPLAAAHPVALAALPLALGLLLLTVLHMNSVLIFLLFSRGLLDPILDSTKVPLMGDAMGLGGILNLLVIALGIALAWSHAKAVLANPTVRRWLLFLAVCLVSIFYSPVPEKGIKLFLYFMSYLSMMVIPFCLIRNPRDKRFWMRILLASFLLPVFFADLDFLRGGVYYADAGMRVQGTFSHPNILAFYLVLTWILSFYALKTPTLGLRPWARHGLKFLILNCCVLLIATKTRNAWISAWLFFVFYGLLREKKYLFFSLLLPPLALTSSPILERVQDLLRGTGGNVESELNSFAWRLELWARSLAYAKDHFLFGYGLNSFRPLSASFFQGGVAGVPAHNTYVQMIFETGILGAFCYAAIYWSALKTFFARVRASLSQSSFEYAIAAAYLISYAFSCAGDNLPDYLAFNWYVWFFIGILLKSSCYGREKSIGHYSLV